MSNPTATLADNKIENCARAVQRLFALAILFSSQSQLLSEGGGGVGGGGGVINELQTYLVRKQVHFINAEFSIKYLVNLQTIKNTGFIQEN